MPAYLGARLPWKARGACCVLGGAPCAGSVRAPRSQPRPDTAVAENCPWEQGPGEGEVLGVRPWGLEQGAGRGGGVTRETPRGCASVRSEGGRHCSVVGSRGAVMGGAWGSDGGPPLPSHPSTTVGGRGQKGPSPGSPSPPKALDARVQLKGELLNPAWHSPRPGQPPDSSVSSPSAYL